MALTKCKTTTENTSPFMCGCCEGFYGKPWTTVQRKELFNRMQTMQLNTYLYAPKDDHKHRLNWRVLYTEEETDDLKTLIKSAKEHNVEFVYALSPGLDITYSSKQEVDFLKNKLDQVKKLGCKSFSLLFDDIEPDLDNEDQQAFKTPAHAQCSVTNELYNYLGKPKVFLFCPTEYCTSRAVPDIPQSDYLETIGIDLLPGIDVLWTGPKVVSRCIVFEGIDDVGRMLRRQPVIWDNLHANDYDQTRLFLGPYEGRPPELAKKLRGVLTNPNCEFEVNFIALHTLAQWSQNTVCRFPARQQNKGDSSDVEMVDCSINQSHCGYMPKKALVCAAEDWIPVFYKGKVMEDKDFARSKLDENAGALKLVCDKDCDAEMADGANKPDHVGNSIAKKKMEELPPLISEDLLMLSDMFYLPFEHGPRAIDLLKQAHWLISHTDRLAGCHNVPKSEQSPEVREWYDRAIRFHVFYKSIVVLVDKILNIPNRELLYELYNYVGDMRSVLTLINSYIKWQGMGKPNKELFRGGEQEPWVHRGGLHSEFRRMLPLEGQTDMFPKLSKQSVPSVIFTIRPYFSSDKDDVYSVCRKTYDDGVDGSDMFADHPDLPGDQMLGCLLKEFPQFSLVLEDDVGICGYMACAPDVQDFFRSMRNTWKPSMKRKYPPLRPTKDKARLTLSEEIIKALHANVGPVPESVRSKYPSLVVMSILPSRLDWGTTPRRLFDCGVKLLKAKGSLGLHTNVPASHVTLMTVYLKLGFEHFYDRKCQNEDNVIIVKPI